MDDFTQPLGDAQAAHSGGGLVLLVMADGEATSMRLPAAAVLTVGRAPGCEVRIDHGSVSREHALLTVAFGEVMIEDLGSANGTRLGGERVAPRTPVPVPIGTTLHLGEAIVLVQGTSRPPVRRRLWSHAYFEARLAEECDRALAEGRPLSILRVVVEGLDGEAVQTGIDAAIGHDDVVASYAPGELEVLLVGADAARADAIARRLGREVGARATIATLPRDGRSAEALLAQAGRLLRPPSEANVREGPVLDGEATRELVRMIGRAAKGTISILLLGETGVGKEVFAELVHNSSARRGAPFVKLNCAALAESLLESELFGHEKGAFSGATSAKVGLLEAAAGGTVFLDELGEMPANLQAKLLRAIEHRQIMRVGSVSPRTIDVRFVAATNRDPEEEVAAGRFRADLYYRLNGFVVHIPPLRARRDEIPRLAQAFIRTHARALGVEPPRLSARAEALLIEYAWPGNIRELRNVLERAVLLATGDEIEAEHLPLDKMRAAWPAAKPKAAEATAPAVDPAQAERDHVRAVLEQCGGSQLKAAKVLGISDKTLRARLDRLGIRRPRKGDGE